MMYQSLHEMTPEYLSSRFVFRNDITSNRLRNTENKLALPQPRTNYLMKSFSYGGARLWNSQSSDLRAATSLHEFKLNIRHHSFEWVLTRHSWMISWSCIILQYLLKDLPCMNKVTITITKEELFNFLTSRNVVWRERKRRWIGWGGWGEEGRLASESQLLRNMFTHEWLLWLVRRGYIDWQFWQVAIKILVQNNASITYNQKDQRGGRWGRF